jgi:hypothetical protein
MSTYVSISVPEAHYREMLDHLVSLMSERETESESPAAVTEESVSAPPERRWSDEAWERVWRDLRDDTRQALVVIAEQPDEWVPVSALNSALGSSREVQNALSSLTKRAKKHGLTKWGFDAVQAAETGRFRYRMDERTATIVLELAGADRGEEVAGAS